jgi:hypothetical protein
MSLDPGNQGPVPRIRLIPSGELVLNVLMRTQISPVKPWHKMGISKSQYLAIRPWKKAEMSRERLEGLIMSLDQDLLDEIRISVETEDLVQALFGGEAMEE